MKIRFLRLIALVLTAAVLLSGCGMVDFGEYFGAVRSLVDGNAIVPYESMTYERPDMTQLRQTLPARRRKGTMFRPFWTGYTTFTTPMTGSAPTTRWRISITVQI